MKSNISVIIPTLNEEKNLPYALESCDFADQVFVLDAGSHDGTERIASEKKAHFVSHVWEGYAKQKNWGLDNLPISTDWVFILDADEAITAELREELVTVAAGNVAFDICGFYVNRHFIWEGKRINHCGYYPSWNLRFFRKGKARYEERDVHEHMIVEGKVGYLKGEMRHEDRRGREYIWKKHLTYAGLEAREMMAVKSGQSGMGVKPSLFGNWVERRRAIKKNIWPYIPFHPAVRFIFMYFLKRGFMDGKAGLDMCLFMSRYEAEISRRFKEYRKVV